MPPHAEMDFTRSRLSKEQIERLKKEKGSTGHARAVAARRR